MLQLPPLSDTDKRQMRNDIGCSCGSEIELVVSGSTYCCPRRCGEVILIEAKFHHADNCQVVMREKAHLN